MSRNGKNIFIKTPKGRQCSHIVQLHTGLVLRDVRMCYEISCLERNRYCPKTNVGHWSMLSALAHRSRFENPGCKLVRACSKKHYSWSRYMTLIATIFDRCLQAYIRVLRLGIQGMMHELLCKRSYSTPTASLFWNMSEHFKVQLYYVSHLVSICTVIRVVDKLQTLFWHLWVQPLTLIVRRKFYCKLLMST